MRNQSPAGKPFSQHHTLPQLSNTCSLSGSMSETGYQDLMKMIKSQRKFKKRLAFLPFPLIKRMMRWAVMKKKTDGFTPQEKAAMEELCGAMMELLTKPYEQHMIDFLCDAEHYFGMTCDDFAPWEGRVLLILSEDDTTFTPACREDLIALMPSPTVVTDLTGGHLALMVRLEQYADLRRDLSRSVFAKQCAIRIDKQQKERYNNVVIDNDVII